LRALLAIPPDATLLLERYSDSAASFVTLDSQNPAIYKQLYRAAKAKLKLRLKATLIPANKSQMNDLYDEKVHDAEDSNLTTKSEPRSSYLQTVLSQPISPNKSASGYKSFQELNRTARMPGAFVTGDSYMEPPPRPAPRSKDFSQPTLPCFRDFSGTYSIDCDKCGKSVSNEHYHCGICRNGDFDLCPACVENGVLCDGEGHWLIKRFIRNSMIIPSITETRAPRKVKQEEVENSTENEEDERTCNSCINRTLAQRYLLIDTDRLSELPASAFVTCKTCDDFDLCHPW
jgi:next to BRCA1 gene 1 protein